MRTVLFTLPFILMANAAFAQAEPEFTGHELLHRACHSAARRRGGDVFRAGYL